MLRVRLRRALVGLGAFLAGLAFVSAAAAEPLHTNLLQNPGFESGTEGHPWMPADWDTSESGLPSVFFGRDTFLVHGGRYAVSVANLSTLYPMWHNWSQSLVVGPGAWGKDVVFTAWTRSNGLQGRAYIIVQAYRDTIGKMAKIWAMDRDDAGEKMGIHKIADPLADLGWKRDYFTEPETDWVKREVRVYVPPTTNMIYVRCGMFGTGQVIFDDASLTLEPARPPDPVALNTNLIADPGFEGDGNRWEYAMPPYEGMRVERDTTLAHTGKACIHAEGGMTGLMSTRAGVCQVLCNRNLSNRHIKLSAFLKTDSLVGRAYISLFYHTKTGVVPGNVGPQYSQTMDWTELTLEDDVPPETYALWAWFMYEAPATGRVYYDDCSLVVTGPSHAPPKKAEPPPARRKATAARTQSGTKP